MTLHIRQAPTEVEIENLVNSAFSNRTADGLYRNHLKRFLDILLVTLTALPALTIVGICAALVSLDGGKPFYAQPRIGRFGKSFRMWKLRTMVPNADDALEKYLKANPGARAEWEHSQKLRQDPRITKIGQFLRKTSLDEIPQLWNVFKGEMSIVGPRPMMVDQQSLYPGSAYYALRPGLTGFWQISERHESSFAERATYDADYLAKVTLTEDVLVMWKTVGVVTRGTGC